MAYFVHLKLFLRVFVKICSTSRIHARSYQSLGYLSIRANAWICNSVQFFSRKCLLVILMEISKFRALLRRQVIEGLSVSEIESSLHMIDSIIVEFLEDAISRVDIVDEIQRESFLHQTGFDRFVLIHDAELSWRLRLNVWWPEHSAKLREAINVHNHVWDHASLILSGIMENHFYAVEEGKEMLCYKTQNKGMPNESVDLVGRRSITPSELLTRSTGESYHQFHNQFHRIAPKSEFLATLCFQTSPMTDETFAIQNKPYTPLTATVDRPPVAVVRAKLKKAINQIASSRKGTML